MILLLSLGNKLDQSVYTLMITLWMFPFNALASFLQYLRRVVLCILEGLSTRY